MQSSIVPKSARESVCALFFVSLVVASMCATAWAQHPQESAPRQKAPPPSTPQAPKGGHALTAEDVGAFSDGIVPVQLGRDDIAGAVLVLVKDGKVLFAKGYGYADVEKKKPVTVDATLFRPGSISKLFTWTSVMQQVEQGKLDLDKDVNEYLDFKIPSLQGKPITLRNLMTHTPGFEEAIKNLFVPANRMQPLDVYLKKHLPVRIYPPGTTIGYSNYATALAGYLVQRVSGMSFEAYVEQNIFKPLHMQHTTFRQPLPDALKPLMSNGYLRRSDQPKEFETVQAAPAGSLSTTGEDLAHFMIAHLQDGTYSDASILKRETVQFMHAHQYASTDNLNGMCLGFYEESANGHRIIGHGGDTMYFHSDLHLVPDVGLGFFISYNSAGKGDVRRRAELWQSFLDRYFPYEPPAVPSPGNAATDARSVRGAYRSSRGHETSLAKLVSILSEVIISSGPNNTVQVDAVREYNGKPKRWRAIGPMTFREENGQNRMMFYRDRMGHFTAALDAPAVLVFFRAPWYQDKRFVQAAAIGVVVIFVLTLVLWPIGGLMRRHYGRVLEPQYRSMRVLVRLVCAFDLGVLTAWVITFTKVGNNLEKLNDSLDPTVRVLQILTPLAAILMLVPLYNLVRSWTTPARWWVKVHDTLIALACVTFVYLGLVTKLLGFNLRF